MFTCKTLFADWSRSYAFEDLAAKIREWPVAFERKDATVHPFRAQGKADAERNAFERYGEEHRAPVDVEARLAGMRFQGAGESGVHATQLSVTASLLEAGWEVEAVVERVLGATRAALNGTALAWDWRREEADIRRMCVTWVGKRQSGAREGAARARDSKGQPLAFEDFVAYSPKHNYVFLPTGEHWPAETVDARLPTTVLLQDGKPVKTRKGDDVRIKGSLWLDRHQAVDQKTWAPGEPEFIHDRVLVDGGWKEAKGKVCLNTYKWPAPPIGDASEAQTWLDHIECLFPQGHRDIVRFFAHRVQKPWEKINHVLVLGGAEGIGKDTILEPVIDAIGRCNFADITPSVMMERFNGFAKSVMLRISEGRDLGDVDRYRFNEHLKVYACAPPDMLRIDQKHMPAYTIPNVTGVVITTNHKEGGIYIAPGDRRHSVQWSSVEKEDLAPGYFRQIYAWYAAGGMGHVAAYLNGLDLSDFDAKAPPEKTPAWWDIVLSQRPPENAEMADALEACGRDRDPQADPPMPPAVVTLEEVALKTVSESFANFLRDRKNARTIPHRFEECGYVRLRNERAKDGLWVIHKRRQVVYARRDLSVRDQYVEAQRWYHLDQ